MLNNENKFLWWIWGVVFLYVCVLGLFVQLLLLPHLLPALHAGDGLFVGMPDCKGLHQEAVAMAERIKVLGWKEWELRPDGGGPPVGIATIMYVLTWSIILFPAVLPRGKRESLKTVGFQGNIYGLWKYKRDIIVRMKYIIILCSR